MKKLGGTIVLAGAALVSSVRCGRSDSGPPTLTVDVHAGEWFEIADPTVAAAWPGDGVAALAGRLGRLEPTRGERTLFIRAADGTLERRALTSRPTDRDLRTPFLSAARDEAARRVTSDAGSLWDARVAEFAAPLPETPPAAESEPEGPARAAPPIGADLAAWAPAGRPFVRFRSVESAFRFCDLADRVAARLLSVTDDGRDHGTLRWAVHDLVLPEIWRANPEGEKGVGECALVVDDVVGARPSVALLLRVRDPELHAMETEAGVRYAAMPEHRWRPEGDPDPDSRVARGARRTVGDVEIVATSAPLLDRLLGRSAPTLDEDAAWQAIRDPARAEAFLLFQDARTRNDRYGDVAAARDAWLRGERELAGLRTLWTRWTGLPPTPAFLKPHAASPRDLQLLRRLVSVRCVTDAKGAAFDADFTDADAAELARAALARTAEPLGDASAVCETNRRDVAALALVERRATDLAERAFVVLGWRHVCPSGGTYEAHPITRVVSCTAHGTTTTPLLDAPPAPPLLRDVVRDGVRVSFRAPLRW